MVEADASLERVRADRLPVPVCSFVFEEGVPVVRGTNRVFADQLAPVQTGEAVTALFDSLFDAERGWDDLPERLQTADQFTVRQTGRRPARYLVDVTAPTETDAGYLLFTDVTDNSTVESGSEQCTSPDEGVSEEGTTDTTQDGLAVDHVTSVVSHDLRNPLDVARARLRAGRELDEDEHFDHVEQAHDRMERIIQDVLTLARGEDVVDPDEAVDLGAVAEQAWETVETNGTTLSVEGQLPTVRADPDRVSRLFENLFRNAVEHGHSSESGTVQVTVGPLDAPGKGFYVADDGPGISPETHEHMFEPGYSTSEHGTGLGLAIVSRIVDLHGWDIEVTESTSGGARFVVRGLGQR